MRVVRNVDANRAGIGSTVRVHVGDTQWLRHVTGGSGYGCQNSIITHFGLAEAASVDTIEVDFPGGKTVTYDGPFDTNQRLWLHEDGAVVPGWVGSGEKVRPEPYWHMSGTQALPGPSLTHAAPSPHSSSSRHKITLQ